MLVVGSSTISFVEDGIPAGVTPGVAQDVIEFPFNDPDGAEAVLERDAATLAAVIVEPVHGRGRHGAGDDASSCSACAR